MADREQEDAPSRVVRIMRLGLRGLISGIAPEDAAPDSLADMGNMRSDRLGRMNVRPGYEVKHHSLENGDDQIVAVGGAAPYPGEAEAYTFAVGTQLGQAGTNLHFFVNGVEIIGGVIAGTIKQVRLIRVDSQDYPINLVAVDGGVGMFKQYMRSAGDSPRIAGVGDIAGLALNGCGVTEGGAGSGTWLRSQGGLGVHYSFMCATYNPKTGEESWPYLGLGILTPGLLSQNNISITLTDIPVSVAVEGADLHRRIYCKKDVGNLPAVLQPEFDWRLAGTIENNITTTLFMEDPPTVQDNAPVYETAPPTPGAFAAVLHAWGYTWVCDDKAIYFSTDNSALLFDTVKRKILVDGQPLALTFAHDRIYLFTTEGLFFIRRPVGELSVISLSITPLSRMVLEPHNVNTVAVCRDSICFLMGEQVREVTAQGVLGELGPNYLLKDAGGAGVGWRNLAKYDSRRDRLILLVGAGQTSGIITAATRDAYYYYFSKQRWEKDCYAGLWPCSIGEIGSNNYYRNEPQLVLGGAYGTVVYPEGGLKDENPATEFLYDGRESDILLAPAVDGSTTSFTTAPLGDGPFTTADIGCSVVVLRSSVSGYGNKRWQLMGVAPIKGISDVQGTGYRTLNFGHSIGFTVAQGDTCYVGAIPWWFKTQSLASGPVRVKDMLIEHQEAMSSAIVVVPPDPNEELGIDMAGDATNSLQKAFSDARTGMNTARVGVNVVAPSPQVQLCGYMTRPIITALIVEIERLRER